MSVIEHPAARSDFFFFSYSFQFPLIKPNFQTCFLTCLILLFFYLHRPLMYHFRCNTARKWDAVAVIAAIVDVDTVLLRSVLVVTAATTALRSAVTTAISETNQRTQIKLYFSLCF